jgi:hypothetical protein
MLLSLLTVTNLLTLSNGGVLAGGRAVRIADVLFLLINKYCRHSHSRLSSPK